MNEPNHPKFAKLAEPAPTNGATPEHLAGLTQEEIDRHISEVQSTPEAASLPLPGPLASAFAGDGRKLGKFFVRMPVAMDFAILQQLDSPLLKQMAEAAKPKDLRQPTPFTDQDGWDMVFQFTRSLADVEGIIALGPEAYRLTTKQAIGREMNPFIAAEIVKIVGELFVESYATALKYLSSEGEQRQNFPASSKEPATASAGG